MDEIRQLLDKINKQVAILAHQVDMLQLHNSIGLIRLSLLKVPSKIPPLNTSSIPHPISTAAAPSITADTPLPSPPSTAVAHPPFTAAIPPPCLPISLTPPTSLHATVAGSTTATPSSPVKQYNSTHQILKSFSDSHIEFLVGIPDTLHTMSRKQQLKIALNSFDTSKLVGAQISIGREAVFEQKYRKEETSPNIKMLSESKVLVFDPGGTLGVERVFDLEDKVVFEGSVMIQNNDMHIPAQDVHNRPRRAANIPASYLD